MRRSKRSIKRASIPLESSDEDEPIVKQPKSEETSRNKDDNSSSESDIESYLKPAHKLDLNSSFFNLEKEERVDSIEEIENKILSGIQRLSDSDSEENIDENDINESQKLLEEPCTSKAVPKLNFQQLHEFTKKIEEAKKHVEMYEAKKKNEENHLNVNDLLSLGETNSQLTREDLHSSDFESCSDSEKDDWEEVEGI